MVAGDKKGLYALPEAEEKPGSGYVHLHDLQVKYGELTGTPDEVVYDAPKRLRSRRMSPAGNMLEDGHRQRLSSNATATVKPRTAELIQGFEPFGSDILVSENATDKRSYAQLKQEAAMHDQCLASLNELRCLGTELDLTFQSVKNMTSIMQPKHPSFDEGKTASTAGRASGDDDVMLHMEMMKSGREQYLLVRAPQTWELHQRGSGASRKPRPVWGANRPKTPRDLWVSDASNAPTAPATALGDSAHTICIDLCERIPESLILRRMKATLESTKASTDGKSGSAAVAIGSSKSKGVVSVRPDGHTHLLDGDAFTAQIPSMTTQCSMLEKNFGQKFADRLDEPALVAEDFDPQVGEAEVSEGTTNGAAAAAAAVRAELSNAVRERAGSHVQDYVRDIRAALRLLGPFLPGAARVVEGAVKGLLVALDVDLTLAWKHCADLEDKLATSNVESFEADMLRRQVRDMQKENKELKEKLSDTEHRMHEEANRFRHKIDMLNEEIVKLSPDQSELDGVAGLMGDYKNLMAEMEEECVRQGDILQKMQKYTMDVIGEASADQSKPRRHQQGRVVELMDGEILLRPYDIADKETQVTEAELTYIDTEVPVRFRTQQARHILAMFDGKSVPSITLEEISAEIDKIYNEKIRADADADIANMQRCDLGDFIVEYYLNSLHSVKLAQEKLCSFFQCLRQAERNSTVVSPKVALFARFLGFCDFEQALPVTVLNAALQAKKLAQASLHKQKVDGPLQSRAQMLNPQQLRGKPRESTLQSPSAESQLPVALAYEAAVKALPQSSAAHQTVFSGISQCADVDGLDVKRQLERDLLVLVLLLHDRLHREAAPKLRDLIQRAENRGLVAAEEFRDAIHDAQVFYVEDSIWIKKLSETGIAATPGQLNTDLILEYFSGGSISRFPRATITETALMTIVTDAVADDYADRTKHLYSLWKRQTQTRHSSALTFADFVSVVQAEEPNMPLPMLRAAFLASVEASRACTQLIDDVCLPVGNCEAVEEQYGGDVVTFPLFMHAAMKLGLFLKEHNQPHFHGARHGTDQRHGHGLHHHGFLADLVRGQTASTSYPAGSGHAAAVAAAASGGHGGGAAAAPKRGAAPRITGSPQKGRFGDSISGDGLADAQGSRRAANRR